MSLIRTFQLANKEGHIRRKERPSGHAELEPDVMLIVVQLGRHKRALLEEEGGRWWESVVSGVGDGVRGLFLGLL